MQQSILLMNGLVESLLIMPTHILLPGWTPHMFITWVQFGYIASSKSIACPMKVLTDIVYSPVQLSLRVPWGFKDVAP